MYSGPQVLFTPCYSQLSPIISLKLSGCISIIDQHNQLILTLPFHLDCPEYAYTLKVDEKSDVYSFGVVLLELVTGRKPVGEFGDGVDIVQWTKMMTDSNKEQVTKILDPRLSTVPLHEVMHVFYVALLCIEEQSVQRPTMREVVQMLSELPPSSKQGEEVSNAGDGSAASPLHPAPAGTDEAPTDVAKDQQQPQTSSQPSPPDLISI